MLFFLILATFFRTMNITVIGETNIDIRTKAISQLNGNGCTPSVITFHFGGVARNIATNLSKMAHNVRLMTLFGDDDYASQLKQDCEKREIKLDLSDTKDGYHSPIFLSLTDEIGNVKTAFSDMEINNLMGKEWIESKMSEINRADIVVADTLLNEEALAFLIDHCDVPVFIDTVSPNKAVRLAQALKKSRRGIFALKCNQQEAFALTSIGNPKTSVIALNRLGIEHAYVTLGADGVIYSDGADAFHAPALSANVVNVMGSGDAFLAGIIDAFSKGKKGETALPYGLAASKTIIESSDD